MWLILALAGSFTVPDIEDFEKVLDYYKSKKRKKFIIELKNLKNMSSEALSVMLKHSKDLKRKKGGIVVINPNDKIEDELKISNAVKEIKTSVLLINVRQNGMNGLPIKNARVMVTHDGGKEYVNQTDDAGIVMLSDLPYGKIDVDVTSSGRKSDADSLVLDEPQETLTFQLKPRPPAE